MFYYLTIYFLFKKKHFVLKDIEKWLSYALGKWVCYKRILEESLHSIRKWIILRCVHLQTHRCIPLLTLVLYLLSKKVASKLKCWKRISERKKWRNEIGKVSPRHCWKQTQILTHFQCSISRFPGVWKRN